MEDVPNFIVVLDFEHSKIIKIKLSEEEKSEEYDDIEELVDSLSEKYGFSFSDCQWMEMDELNEENIGF